MQNIDSRNQILPNSLIPLDLLIERSKQAYLDCDGKTLPELPRVSSLKKRWSEQRIKQAYKKLHRRLKRLVVANRQQTDSDNRSRGAESGAQQGQPNLDLHSNRPEIREAFIHFIDKIDRERLLFNRPFLNYFISQGYLDAAEVFIDQAEQEDPSLGGEEIFQAMRNVWIMNSLQLYFGSPLKMSESIYGYSMLYPYTDNYLDRTDIDSARKQAFNRRLSARLRGQPVQAHDPRESRVFELVGKIEFEYDRSAYPAVYESILLIQDAQVLSLRQDHALSELSDDDMLSISFYKGGTSVLADAYLVKAELSLEEMDFSFRYGTFLQLLDDFQDAQTDRAEGHRTIFSDAGGEMDEAVIRLVQYTRACNRHEPADSEMQSFLKDLIFTCSLTMILDVIGRHPGQVSAGLYRRLESHAKVRLRFYREIESAMKEMAELFKQQ